MSKAWILRCPGCWGEYLHHDRVTVYPREEDHEADVQVIDVPDGRESRKLPAWGRPPLEVPLNPSERRSGLVVEGWCELCNVRWQMTIAQHKGQTEIEISRAERDADDRPVWSREGKP